MSAAPRRDMAAILQAQARAAGEAPEVRESGSPEVRESATPEVPESGIPKWREMERKEALLRPDQVEQLAALERRVRRQRQSRSERITQNTLIRVALDLLFAHAGSLSGDSEDALRASVGGAEPPNPRG